MILPEEAPTCEACGGQIQHPSEDFAFPPENGLCAGELPECENSPCYCGSTGEHDGCLMPVYDCYGVNQE